MIIIFESTYYVMKAEKILKQNSIDCKIIPTPRDLSSSCSAAIFLENKYKNDINNILLESKIKGQVVNYEE